MKAIITGGLGFIGTQLSIQLLEKGHQVAIIDHSPQPGPNTPEKARYIYADTTVPGAWQEEVRDQDVVINLAGASIFRRWDDNAKKSIYESRILTTRNIVEAMPDKRGTLLCNTSAVGYYGFRGDEKLTEKDGPGDDFLAGVCVDWEKEANKAINKGARVAITRFGIVLGKTGGVLGKMIPAFKRFAGGPLGNGEQWFSWIHMEDLLNAFLFVVENKNMYGPINFCSPDPVRNRDFAKALGKVLFRPAFLPMPAFILRIALGEFGSVLLEGQRVIPSVLLSCGFAFKYPDITAALREVVGKPD